MNGFKINTIAIRKGLNKIPGFPDEIIEMCQPEGILLGTCKEGFPGKPRVKQNKISTSVFLFWKVSFHNQGV
jgi:hypothetical protein